MPEELYNLSNLNILDLSHNQLKTLPKNIDKLINLNFLNINNNILTKIPTDLHKLNNLVLIECEYNQVRIINKKLLSIKNFLNINETTYEINNLSEKIEIIIFKNLNISLSNLPPNIKEIWITEFNTKNIIKLPFETKIFLY